MRVGQLSRLLKFFRDQNVHHAIMAGQIAPKNLFDLRPDWKALLLLAQLKHRNAESIFAAIADELAKVGVDLLPAASFLEDSLAPAGLIAGPKLSRREEEDVAFGWNIATKIARFDIGQTIIVKNGTDRKSTRLNSSHTVISYAVFCLKKKKRQRYPGYAHRDRGAVTR